MAYIPEDPYFLNTACHFTFDRDDGEQFENSRSLIPTRITLASGASFVTNNQRFGVGCARLPVSSSYMYISSNTAVYFRGINFSIEGHFKESVLASGLIEFFKFTGVTNGFASGWSIRKPAGSRSITVYDAASGLDVIQSPDGAIPSNLEYFHVCVERVGATVTIYIEGQPVASGSYNPPEISYPSGSTFIQIGSGMTGYLDEVRITLHAARYGGAFTPAQTPIPDWNNLENIDVFSLDGEIEVSSEVGNQDESAAYVLGDVIRGAKSLEFAGTATISGTVKEKSDPSNLALHRKVRLVREFDGQLVDETWSDPTTGAYVFQDVSPDWKYTVISYDHTGKYRGVIADGLTAEVA